MKSSLKRPFCIAVFAILFSSFGCSKPAPAPSVSDKLPPLNSSSLSSIDNNESTSKPQNAPVDPDVWDLSDVDVSNVDTNKKLISFTFDDSPNRTLENIFAVYAEYNEQNPDCKATATVFFNGYLMNAQSPHLLATACALGFELGNHTYSHYDLTTLDEATLRDEIDKMDDLLGAVDGKKRHLLRAPYGKTSDFIKARSPVPLINWTIDTLDWTGVSADTIYRTVYDNRFSGAIVLMHDGPKNTVDALKRLLPDLKADGYQVVGVSQLAKAHGCVLKKGSTYIRARKQF